MLSTFLHLSSRTTVNRQTKPSSTIHSPPPPRIPSSSSSSIPAYLRCQQRVALVHLPKAIQHFGQLRGIYWLHSNLDHWSCVELQWVEDLCLREGKQNFFYTIPLVVDPELKYRLCHWRSEWCTCINIHSSNSYSFVFSIICDCMHIRVYIIWNTSGVLFCVSWLIRLADHEAI